MTTTRNIRISRDIAVCALIVLVSILLHSLSLPILFADAGARDEYRTESGLPYLSEMDSYLYCRLTEDLATGDLSEYTLRHSRGDDPYISANATGEEGDVVMGLPILGATVYKLLSWVPGVTPYGVIYWLGPFLASLTAIPVYVFVRRRLGARAGMLGGLVAAVLAVTAPSFAWKTHAGLYDTDMGLALLPCTFLLCYAEAMLAKDWRRRLAWGCGSGLALCALSTFWRAYYAHFCIGAAAAFAVVVALLLARLFRGQWLRLTALRGAAIGLAAQLACCLIVRGKELFTDIAGILGNVSGSLANGDPAFPDAGKFVSELQPTPLLAEDYGEGLLDKILNGFAAYADGMLNALGAWPVLLVAAVTTGLLVYFGCRIVFTKRTVGGAGAAAAERGTDDASGDFLITAVFLGVWLACGLFIMTKGARFLTIPVLPVSVVCGFGVGLLHRKLNKGVADEPRPLLRNLLYSGIIVLSVAGWAFAVRAEFGWTPCIIAGVVALIIGGLLFVFKRPALINLLAVTLIFSPCMACAGGSYSAIPDGSDTLQAMCDVIREQTEPDAAIASWWDYGYFYEYAARRLTLGDGGNFSGEWNYWLGQALMTADTDLARGIFRMLADSGLDATYLLMERYKADGDDYARRATDVLKTILPLPREEAYRMLIGENADEKTSNDIEAATSTDATDITSPDTAKTLDARDRLDAAAAEELLALTHPADAHPIYLVLSEDMLRKVGAISTFGRWTFTDEKPATPYLRRITGSTQIASGQTADITFENCDYTLHIERDREGNFTNTKLIDGAGNEASFALRVSSEAGDGILPTFPITLRSTFTVYLREDGDSVYRCLLCDTVSADTVLVRGFMTSGDALLYRSVSEIPETDGTTSLHEVSVWNLGR